MDALKTYGINVKDIQDSQDMLSALLTISSHIENMNEDLNKSFNIYQEVLQATNIIKNEVNHDMNDLRLNKINLTTAVEKSNKLIKRIENITKEIPIENLSKLSNSIRDELLDLDEKKRSINTEITNFNLLSKDVIKKFSISRLVIGGLVGLLFGIAIMTLIKYDIYNEIFFKKYKIIEELDPKFNIEENSISFLYDRINGVYHDDSKTNLIIRLK